jgi:hypothetical protein
MIEPATTIIPSESGAALVSGYYGTPTASPKSSQPPSPGAIAGGTIGVLLGIAIIAAGVLLLFRRKRARAELSGNNSRSAESLNELSDDRAILELPGQATVIELPVKAHIIELPGTPNEIMAELPVEPFYAELECEKRSWR